MTWLRVDLPEPFGPMIACTSPGLTVSDSPWRISRSSTRTCRSLTSSNDITIFCFSSRLFLVLRSAEGASRRTQADNLSSHPSRRLLARPPQDEGLPNRTFEADRDQLLRLDRELHRQRLQHVLPQAADHEADRCPLAQPGLHAVDQHGLRDLRRGRFVLEQRRGILGLDVRHGVRAAFVADQQRVAGGELAGAGRLAMGGDEAAIGVLRDAGGDALGDDPGGGVLAEMNHLGAGIDLLVAVRNRDRIELATRIVAALDAARIFS